MECELIVADNATLADVTDVTISNVDKKTKPGEIPVRLCNYTDVYYNQYIRSDMDFMDATATDREISRCSLFAGDVVITKDSEKDDDIGVPAYVAEDIDDLVCGYHLVILRPNPDKIDGQYLFYSLGARDAQHQFHARANGVTRFGLRKADIGTVTVPLPPLPEQRRIAHILGTLDDKIELNRGMNETLEEMARAVFKDWFVDFGPVRAKMEGRDAYLPEDVWGLFPDRLVESELGLVPEGWGVKALGEVSQERRHSIVPGQIEPGTAYIGLQHMPKRRMVLSEWDQAEGLTSAKLKFAKGDILFGRLRPYFHKVGVAPVDGVCSTDIAVISPNTPNWFGFALGHVSSSDFVNYTDAGSTGTRMPRTNWKEMARYPLILPTESLAKAFNQMIRPTVDLALESIHEAARLTKLRDGLLPVLVSGTKRQ